MGSVDICSTSAAGGPEVFLIMCSGYPSSGILDAGIKPNKILTIIIHLNVPLNTTLKTIIGLFRFLLAWIYVFALRTEV
jgi:hypothetical protein